MNDEIDASAIKLEQSGYDYLVYSNGRIKVYNPEIEEYVLLDQDVSQNGYAVARGVVGEQRLWVTIHQMVALAFLGPTPIKHVITHKDKNRGNNHRDNLEFISRKKSCRRRGTFICEFK